MTPPPTPGAPPLERSPHELRLHPKAEQVPAMPPEERAGFAADVAERGLLVPLEISKEGVVLDGRERLRTALELGLETVPVRIVAVQDELDYMLRAAIFRRQLSASQRAALVLELEQYRELRTAARERQWANLGGGPEVATLPPRGKTREHAARWAGVSPRTLQDAATVREHDQGLFEQVKEGKLGAALAARRVRRALRDQALVKAPPLPEGPFELIYADPPWKLGNPDGAYAPENHYPTMPPAEIEALALPAAEQAVLFLWAVNCLLPQALAVIEAWGFTYKANIAWDKGSIGPGTWLRQQHELLLVGTKGGFPPPEPQRRPASVIGAKRRRHSQKPEAAYELIERAYPEVSKLELFARGTPRAGWAAWGNEVGR
jgi:N6-adenosine-specific RNA methylase IME4